MENSDQIALFGFITLLFSERKKGVKMVIVADNAKIEEAFNGLVVSKGFSLEHPYGDVLRVNSKEENWYEYVAEYWFDHTAKTLRMNAWGRNYFAPLMEVGESFEKLMHYKVIVVLAEEYSRSAKFSVSSLNDFLAIEDF